MIRLFLTGLLSSSIFFCGCATLKKQIPDKKAYTHYTKGLLSELNGALEDAILELNEAVKFEQNPSRIYYFLAKIYLKKGNLNESIKYYEKSRDSDPGWILPKLTLSEMYYATHKYSKAYKECIDVLNVKPDEPDTIELIADIYNKEKKYNEAINYYKKVLSISSNSDKIYFKIAILQSKFGNFDEAIPNYKKSIEINPSNASTHHNLAIVYYIKKQFDLAEVECKETLKYEPLNFDAMKLLSNIYYNLRKLNESLAILEKYLFFNQKDAEIIYIKGVILDEIGNTTQAIKTIENAISLNKYLVGAYIYLAAIYQKSGDKEKEISILEEAIKYIPDDENLKKKLQEINEKNKN